MRSDFCWIGGDPRLGRRSRGRFEWIGRMTPLDPCSPTWDEYSWGWWWWWWCWTMLCCCCCCCWEECGGCVSPPLLSTMCREVRSTTGLGWMALLSGRSMIGPSWRLWRRSPESISLLTWSSGREDVQFGHECCCDSCVPMSRPSSSFTRGGGGGLLPRLLLMVLFIMIGCQSLDQSKTVLCCCCPPSELLFW